MKFAVWDKNGTFLFLVWFTVFHPIGTPAMLLSRPLGGVVDSNLKVYGVQGVIRVAGKLFYNRSWVQVTTVLAFRCINHCVFSMTDAYVLPLQISVHLSSTAYWISEKIGHFVNILK